METFCLKFAKGAVFITSIYIVAVNIWRYFTKDKVEAGNEALQIERLVSAKRSKDDDKRVQIKRPREYRARSPKSEFRYKRIFKRQNTM